MHIQKAKTQIKNAIIAYSAKDENGRYRIPVAKQRPVFLVGAPGIGKTAIVEQIAQELDIGFVSYSMTHHTRQSALGLPFIAEREYGGVKYSVSEYTMSEILASVYDEMERTGKKEGILFLDEINCVSETLAPSMLQFLQYKTFGRHRVPDGWIVVTAGNPSEYNESAREFDIAMLDRLKKIEVEPDFGVWKEFAVQNSVHPAVLSYLAIRPAHFYRVQTTLDGMRFVTARSWDDLSQMLTLYEENNIEADRDLISQYIQDEEIAGEFANYCDLYYKYRSDYQVESIITGTAPETIRDRAANASFDERLSLVHLLVSSLEEKISGITSSEKTLQTIVPEITAMKDDIRPQLQEKAQLYQEVSDHTDTASKVKAASDTAVKYRQLIQAAAKADNPSSEVKAVLRKELTDLKEQIAYGQDILDHVFTFFEDSFGNGQEMLILVSELTIRPELSWFILRHGCPKYYQYNQRLLFDDREKSLNERIDALKLPDVE